MSEAKSSNQQLPTIDQVREARRLLDKQDEEEAMVSSGVVTRLRVLSGINQNTPIAVGCTAFIDAVDEIERLLQWQAEAANTQQVQFETICRQEDEIERLRAALARIEENECPCGDIARAALRGEVETTPCTK